VIRVSFTFYGDIEVFDQLLFLTQAAFDAASRTTRPPTRTPDNPSSTR
jgi:hypothetical protein